MLLFEHYLRNVKRKVPKRLTRYLLQHCKMADRPLFLQLVASHLQHRDVSTEEFVEKCLEKSSVRELLGLMLTHWCDWLSWSCGSNSARGSSANQSGGWVADSLRLLVLSRCGLSIEDLHAALPTLGYHGSDGVSKLQVTSLVDVLLGCVLRYNERGLLVFTHQHLRDCIEHALISEFTNLIKVFLHVSGWFR